MTDLFSRFTVDADTTEGEEVAENEGTPEASSPSEEVAEEAPAAEADAPAEAGADPLELAERSKRDGTKHF